MRDPWEPDEEALQRAYEFIVEFMRQKAYAPTLGQITEGMGYRARSTAYRLVIGMEERGWITRSMDRRRIIRLTRGED